MRFGSTAPKCVRKRESGLIACKARCESAATIICAKARGHIQRKAYEELEGALGSSSTSRGVENKNMVMEQERS